MKSRCNTVLRNYISVSRDLLSVYDIQNRVERSPQGFEAVAAQACTTRCLNAQTIPRTLQKSHVHQYRETHRESSEFPSLTLHEFPLLKNLPEPFALFCTRSIVHLKKAVIIPHNFGISLAVCQEQESSPVKVRVHAMQCNAISKLDRSRSALQLNP